eukprot:scaffold15878_cov137-Isochrysis_galbana.AAC.2
MHQASLARSCNASCGGAWRSCLGSSPWTDEALSTSDLYLSVGVCACGARQLYEKKRTAARRMAYSRAHMAALAVGLICACGTRQLSEEAQAARLLISAHGSSPKRRTAA